MALNLMPLANFGTGYFQGQQQAEQNQVMNQMNKLALGEQQLKYEQDQLSAQRQKDLSDDAIKAFSPTAGITMPGSGNPVPPAAMPGSAVPQPSPVEGMDTAQKMDYLANNAAARGDLVGANELWTNAVNVRSSQAMAQQKQDAIKTAELNRQIKSHSFVAQLLGSATDADDFQQKKFQAIGSGLMSPEEAQNIMRLQYSPEVVDNIRQSGMNSSQQAQAQLRQMEFAEKQRNEALNQERKDRDQARKDLHEQQWEQHQTKMEKTGGVMKAPSSEELKIAAPIVASALGIEQDDDLLSAPSPTNPKAFTQSTPAMVGIVSRAKQIVAGNKAIPFTQAVNMSVQEAKANGELGTTKEKTGLFGLSTKTVNTYKEKGESGANPLPLPKNVGQLIPGKWYVGKGGKVQQYNPQGGHPTYTAPTSSNEEEEDQ